MTITTFTNLIASPVSEKVFLAELRPAEYMQGWTAHGTQPYVYYKDFCYDRILLSDGTYETIIKNLDSIECNGSAYTSRASVADVSSFASSYFFDTSYASSLSFSDGEIDWEDTFTWYGLDWGDSELADVAGRLFVHTADDTSPDNYTAMVFFWLYFATKGIILNSKYYEPYIAENGIPRISQETSELHWGTSRVSVGEIVLLNSRGYFDQISKKYIWLNKTAKILLGGESLAYGEYETLFTMLISDTKFTQRDFTLGLKSTSYDLLETSLPKNLFDATTYPNLDENADGQVIPLGYGVFSEFQAPVVTCINSAYGTNTYQFKICDCTYWPIKEITNVYIDYDGNNTWQSIAHSNESLSAATFTITDANFVLGTSKIKVAFEGYHNSGTLIEGAPEIAEDILTTWCGYASGDLNSTSFTDSKAISDIVLNVWVNSDMTALQIIEKICQSDLAFFDEDAAGLLRYRTWEPSQTGTLPVIDSTDILGDNLPEVTEDSNHLYSTVKVGYSHDNINDIYLYAESTSTLSQYKYSNAAALTYDTYLRSSYQAGILAARLLWILGSPYSIINFELKAAQINKLLGDKLKITLARAPYSSSGGYSERVFEITGRELSCFPLILSVTARDLMEFGNDAGMWMDDDDPAWSSATAQEREDSGFWTDDDGYIVTGDDTTKNKSRWW